jgi:hypothetical protein
MFWATVGLVSVSVLTAGVSYFLLRSRVDPHVIVYTKHDEDRPSMLLIVIENIGSGPAYDVTFDLARPIPTNAWGVSSDTAKPPGPPMTEGPLISGIPMLAPGERRVLNWGQFGGLIESVGDRAIKVTASFRSRKQFPWDPTDHAVESLLEIKSFERTDASEPPNVRQARALEGMAKDVTQVTRVLRDVGNYALGLAREWEEEKARQLASTDPEPELIPPPEEPNLAEESSADGTKHDG